MTPHPTRARSGPVGSGRGSRVAAGAGGPVGSWALGLLGMGLRPTAAAYLFSALRSPEKQASSGSGFRGV